jgi:hypothetical protein
MKHHCKKSRLFHITGIACLIWFAVRVLPAPHRAQYPCQQISKTIGLGYIAFWSILLSGLLILIKQARHKTSKVAPSLVVACIILVSLSSMVFASIHSTDITETLSDWNPIPNEPIGTPTGYSPGRVVWTWNPDATEQQLDGYWWETQNNNQSAIDAMYSEGLQALTGETLCTTAWDDLFRYFNINHDKGDIGYQPGEKIAIKINMNNIYGEPYDSESQEIDASPYVVKALLHQLVDIVGVTENDITVFDASRKIPDWFYNRVYYENYPTDSLIPEFPGVHFAGAEGDAPGREQVIPSTTRVYFAAGETEYRTLPTCVADAAYLINMPIVKRHVQDRVTLAGKNLFGTFIEPVVDIHDYHTIGFSAMGNPAPQVDLLAHEQLGGKTILYIGDGTYGCRYGNAEITHFQMYPFNDDWMSSLFFSQDPVAIDSVMYDFLYADGTGPSERAQNYIHQAAEPNLNCYDPEGDGIYLDHSLGVHEHADLNINIFSSERYIGPSGNGIDYIPLGQEHAAPTISITTPRPYHLYFLGKDLMYLHKERTTLVIGRITVETAVYGADDTIDYVDFFLDNKVVYTANEQPYSWMWDTPSLRKHTIQAIAYSNGEPIASEEHIVWKIL